MIQQFPYAIGRFSPRRPFSSVKGDLLIADHRAEPISEHHLSIERRDDRIILSDPNSRTGSLVNNQLLGTNAGGKEQIELKQGEHEVILGRSGSPPRTSSPRRIILPVSARKEPWLSYGRFPEIKKPLICSTATHRTPTTFSDIIVAHSVNVAIYALKFFGSLSYAGEEIENMGATALLHEIGLFDIPREIVYKNTRIIEKEYEVLKTHSSLGHEKLSGIPDEY